MQVWQIGGLTRECESHTCTICREGGCLHLRRQAGRCAGVAAPSRRRLGTLVPWYLSELLCSLIFQASQHMLIGPVARQIHGIRTSVLHGILSHVAIFLTFWPTGLPSPPPSLHFPSTLSYSRGLSIGCLCSRFLHSRRCFLALTLQQCSFR